MSVLSTGCSNHSSAPAKIKGRKKTTLWKFFQSSKKEPSEFPRKSLLSSYWPRLCYMSISRPTAGKGCGTALIPFRAIPGTEAHGLCKGGVDAWTKCWFCQDGRSRKQRLTSNRNFTRALSLSLPSCGVGPGEGQAGSQSLPVQTDISWDVPFSFCSLVSVIPLTTTVSSLDTKPTPLASPAGPSSPNHKESLSLLVLRPPLTIPCTAPRENARFLGWWSFKYFAHNTGAQESLTRLFLTLSARMVSNRT